MLEDFWKLMGHLNSEDNDMAHEFSKKLKEAEKRLEKLDALESGGVDNWSGYSDCFDEDEDE